MLDREAVRTFTVLTFIIMLDATIVGLQRVFTNNYDAIFYAMAIIMIAAVALWARFFILVLAYWFSGE